MAAGLKLIGKVGKSQIVQLDDDHYYYGDGLNKNSFSWTPEIWAKFEIYIDKPEKGEKISDDVLDYLEAYADDGAEAMVKAAEEMRHKHATVWMDSRGNVVQKA